MERAAKGLLGAASGGVIGILVSGLLATGAWGMVGCMVGLATVVGLLNLRLKPDPKPASPGASLAGVLGGTGLLLSLVVLLGQSVYVQVAWRGGEKPKLPLAIWPLSEAALWVAVLLSSAAMISGFLGWYQARKAPGDYSGGRLAQVAILAGAATLAVAMLCYLTGYGFPMV